MFQFIYIKNLFLFILVSIFLLSCENTGDKQTLKQIAITNIANYADGKGPKPTIRNYEDAGIIGVNERNIDELNVFIETLRAENIDTAEELNAVIDALGVSLASDIFGPVITIHGPNPLTLNVGEQYKKVCATAIDNRDGEVQVYVQGDVDTSKIGTYTVTYSAVDEAGNLTSVKRIVHIIEKPVEETNAVHYLHFIVTQDPYLSGINITVNNISNGDSITQNWVYPSNQSATLNFTFATPLQVGESYTLEIPPLSSSGPVSVQDNCYFSSPINDNTTSGVMGNSDITFQIECPPGA